MGHLWPLFDLVVSTPAIALRIPNDAQLIELTGVITSGIHDSSWMPFDDHPVDR